MCTSRCESEVTEYGKTYKRGQFLPFYVPRPEMPQVNENDLPHLVADAFTRANMSANMDYPYGVQFDAVEPHTLRFHQRVDVHRAAAMDPVVKMKPILVSADGYVLDGNHRLWRHLHDNDPLISIIRVGLPFDKAVPWLIGRPYVWEIKSHPQVTD